MPDQSPVPWGPTAEDTERRYRDAGFVEEDGIWLLRERSDKQATEAQPLLTRKKTNDEC